MYMYKIKARVYNPLTPAGSSGVLELSLVLPLPYPPPGGAVDELGSSILKIEIEH